MTDVSMLPSLAAIWVECDSWCTHVRVFPGHLSQSRITRLCGMCLFPFEDDAKMFPYSHWTNLYSHAWHMEVPVAPHLCQHLLLPILSHVCLGQCGFYMVAPRFKLALPCLLGLTIFSDVHRPLYSFLWNVFHFCCPLKNWIVCLIYWCVGVFRYSGC